MKNRHDIKRLRPTKKPKKVSVSEKAIRGLNYDMANAHLINIKNT